MTRKHTLAALSLLLSASLSASRLIVYGPQDLKDKFEYAGNSHSS